ncbi:hypothetical protein C8R43DRAFT_699442 [Mycena crocata]|nr:hypothetical protein C8R43DRAFT_699442 [Mycena crocata]
MRFISPIYVASALLLAVVAAPVATPTSDTASPDVTDSYSPDFDSFSTMDCAPPIPSETPNEGIDERHSETSGCVVA